MKAESFDDLMREARVRANRMATVESKPVSIYLSETHYQYPQTKLPKGSALYSPVVGTTTVILSVYSAGEHVPAGFILLETVGL